MHLLRCTAPHRAVAGIMPRTRADMAPKLVPELAFKMAPGFGRYNAPDPGLLSLQISPDARATPCGIRPGSAAKIWPV